MRLRFALIVIPFLVAVLSTGLLLSLIGESVVAETQSEKFALSQKTNLIRAMDNTNITEIAVGDDHTCALLESGSIKCWGGNDEGQLGTGTIDLVTTAYTTPVSVIGLGGIATAIAAGDGHTCALLHNGVVKCWGDRSVTPSEVWQLKNVAAISAYGEQTCALLSSGSVKCWRGGNVNRPDNRPVDILNDQFEILEGVTAIATGGGHSCALLQTGGVKCWGNDSVGQLGDGDPYAHNLESAVDVVGLSSGVSAIAAGHAHTCAVLQNGVKCWGSNRSGELGIGLRLIDVYSRTTPVDVIGLSSGVTSIAPGNVHTCASLESGGVKCWGSGGNLGDGTTTLRLTPVNVVGLSEQVSAISAGRHTCVLIINSNVKCWGENWIGQLGDGTVTIQRTTPVDVIGLTGVATACSSIELAEHLAPHMYFHEDDIYRPIAIAAPLEHANLTDYIVTSDLEGNRVITESVQVNAPLTFESLNGNLNRTNIYIDFLGKEPTGMHEKYETVIEPKASQLAYIRYYCPPTPVTIAPNIKTKTVIQYWFFYYDNPWGFVHHEGDWEMIQVMLNENNVPTHAGYSQHFKGSKRKWSHVQKEATHPVVYVAEGSHASFFVKGNCNYSWCVDDTSPVHQQHGVIAVSSNITPWINFKGHWGGLDSLGSNIASPPGPQYRIAEHLNNISLWDDPIAWFLALPPDEETDSNKVEKINVSVSAPLAIDVATDTTSNLGYSHKQVHDGSIPNSEYIDNPETGKRTFIIHEPNPDAIYTVTVKVDQNSNLPLTSAGLNLHFADIAARKNITAQYQFPPEWNSASVAVLKLQHATNFEMRIDNDNDNIIDQTISPTAFKEQVFSDVNTRIYLPLVKR